MAITTMDGLVAAIAAGQRLVFQKASITTVAGFYCTLFNAGGIPGAGSLTVGNTANGLVPTDALGGAPLVNAFAGANTGYIATWDASLAQAGVLSLYDRLWHAGSFSTAALTTFNLTAQPSFSSRLPGGSYVGVEMWLEINAANGATATTVQVTYYNQNGAGDGVRTATLDSNLTSFPAARMMPFRLQAGDSGVSQVLSVVVGGATGTMTFNIVLMRNLVDHTIVSANIGRPKKNAFDTGLPIVYADSCLALMFLATTTSSGVLFAEGLLING